MKNTIIILGMHRSGTSLIAELIHKWGACAGDEQSLLPADDWNEQGYWEYLPLVRFNTGLLKSVDADWSLPPGWEDEGRLSALALDKEVYEQALQLIQTMESSAKTWFWKDPRLSIVLPFWKNILSDPIYIIPVRNPLATAASLQRIFHFPRSASLLLWQRYMMAILAHTRDYQRVLFIEYETLLMHPQKQCARLTAFLDEQCHPNECQTCNIGVLAQTVNPLLRHHDEPDVLSEMTLVSGEQKRLYEYLRGRAEDRSEEYDEAAFGIYPGWKEYLQCIGFLQQLKGQWQGVLRMLPKEELPLISESARKLFGF